MNQTVAKSRCETCGQWFEDSELDGHLNQHVDEPAEPTTEPTSRVAMLAQPHHLRPHPTPRATAAHHSHHPHPGRSRRRPGSDPAARLLLGWVSELGEEPIMMDMYVCPQCGRILQYANKTTRNRLKRSAPHQP